MALPPVTALARTIAARFAANSEFWAGSSLNLTTSPAATATARSIDLPEPTIATAVAFGLGTGASRYYTDPANDAYFNSPNLRIYSGGGQIDGTAAAHAFASGRGDTSADAQAINVGLANVAYGARFNGALKIGSSSNPFRASALAGTGSQLDPITSNLVPITSLNASAIVRGLEGLDSRANNGAAVAPSFVGQPNAVVEADATLNFSTWPIATKATASADAKGLEGYTVIAVPGGDGDGKATISGEATAKLALVGTPKGAINQLELSGNAIGIDQSSLYGAPTLNTYISGKGLALFDASKTELTPADVKLQNLQGIGILSSEIYTNRGNDIVQGLGGYTDSGFNGASGWRDAAGIDKSTISTGMGDDIVYGAILNEQDVNLDINGDSVISANTFLDHTATTGGEGGFDGIRNSNVNTGLGNDSIGGSSNLSILDASLGDDFIQLSRAIDSKLLGGMGNDEILIDQLGINNNLQGDFGNDVISVSAGNGNRLDGGFGQDLNSGGSGIDKFIQSDSGVAYTAASSDSFAKRLTENDFWSGLTDTQKDNFWATGTLLNTSGQAIGSVDTMANFISGVGGDNLEISSSLASITESLWNSNNTALFQVDNGLLVAVEGGPNTKLGVVVDSLAEIKSLGIGSPSIAYATDTRQLMFDADGDWNQGSISLGTINISGGEELKKSNFSFA